MLAAVAVSLAVQIGPAVFDEDAAARAAIQRADTGWWAESMKTKDQRIAWWREARWGCFMHWGAYSQLAGVWQGQPVRGYAEHIQRMGKIDQATYRKEAVEKFNPAAFDADKWVSIVTRAGMKYLIITAKHHDGFAMYDSAVSAYDIVDATPFKRDPMKELREACRKQGVKFGFYYSQAFDWGEKDGAGNDWEFRNPGGDLLLGGRDWWLTIPEEYPRIKKNYIDAKSIPQVRELIQNYRPDILWFDTSRKIPFSENLLILEEIRKIDPNVVVNGRLARWMDRNFGDYVNTGDKALEFSTVGGDWETIPTTNESYGHHARDLSHKDPAELIRLLPKAVSRNGNVLLNVGPMANGEIDPKDVRILEGIGDWMAANGESIYGAGLTPLPIQAWGTSTRKGRHLYLQVCDWPPDGRLVAGGLLSDPRSAELLTREGAQPVRFERVSAKDVAFTVGKTAPFEAVSVVKLSFDGDIRTDAVRLLASHRPNALLTFDAERGPGLGVGAGQKNKNFVSGMTGPDGTLAWRVRVEQPATFEVVLSAVPGEPQGTGTLVLEAGDEALKRPIRGKPEPTMTLGTLKLDRGVHTLRLYSPDAAGGEILRPLDITLAPLR